MESNAETRRPSVRTDKCEGGNLGIYFTTDTHGDGHEKLRTEFGPEASKLVAVLREFILNVVGGPVVESKTVIEADLHYEEPLVMDGSDFEHFPHGQEVLTVSQSLSLPSIDDLHNETISNQIVTTQRLGATFHEKVLQELRNQVFNKMPIRLLLFVPVGLHLEISLAEKGAVYAHLSSILESKINDSEYCPRITGPFDRIEPDDEAIDRIISKYCGYAILSHTWLRSSPGEVTYSNWNKRLFHEYDPGYQKLVRFCQTASRNHGFTLGWMDTVCINKESSSELDESIRSMYNWYKRAAMCIIYLADTVRLTDIHVDRWFTRGWTLQELLAPNVFKFYNSLWKKFVEASDNDRTDSFEVLQEIWEATSINKSELLNIRNAPLSRRMQLAATREVTREEDTAYSLMGIFDVSIATAYGEGSERAFSRLLQEILNSTSKGIVDLFNWGGEKRDNHSPISRILPPNPRGYLHCASSVGMDVYLNYYSRLIEPLTLTHMGLRVPVLLMPGVSIDSADSPFEPIGDYSAVATIVPKDSEDTPTTYRLLDKRVSGSDGDEGRAWYQCTFAVFNIAEGNSGIFVPATCIAVLLECEERAGEVTSMGTNNRVATEAAIVFEMENCKTGHYGEYYDTGICGLDIPPEELAAHGMQLVNLYL